jgi:hypothetical protein
MAYYNTPEAQAIMKVCRTCPHNSTCTVEVKNCPECELFQKLKAAKPTLEWIQRTTCPFCGCAVITKESKDIYTERRVFECGVEIENTCGNIDRATTNCKNIKENRVF